jgi:predicted transposase YdaD
VFSSVLNTVLHFKPPGFLPVDFIQYLTNSFLFKFIGIFLFHNTYYLTSVSKLKVSTVLGEDQFSVFAEFERNRISERTKDGQARARSQGKRIGRPQATTTSKLVQEAKSAGLSQSKAAQKTGFSIATVKRHWNVEINH